MTLTLILLLLVVVLLVGSGLLKQPGIGVLLALVVVAIAVFTRPGGLTSLGLADPPAGWGITILAGLVAGTFYALLSTTFIEPAVERLTGKPHDISAVEGARGNLRNLLLWIVMIWVLVALVEELIFRGYLMLDLSRLIGVSTLAVIANLLLTSAVFGLAHSYQGPSGAISTGIAGLYLGGLFVAAGYNLWLVVFTHGVIDTVAFLLIYSNRDVELKKLFIR